jgi:hypothetical protein
MLGHEICPGHMRFVPGTCTLVSNNDLDVPPPLLPAYRLTSTLSLLQSVLEVRADNVNLAMDELGLAVSFLILPAC